MNQNKHNPVDIPFQKILHKLLKTPSQQQQINITDPRQFYNILKLISPITITKNLDDNLFTNNSLNDPKKQLSREDKISGFIKLWKILIYISTQLSISTNDVSEPSQKLISEMVDERQINKIHSYTHLLFQIMLKKEEVLICITSMDQADQIKIKQYIQQNFNTHREHNKEDRPFTQEEYDNYHNRYELDYLMNSPRFNYHSSSDKDNNGQLFDKIYHLENNLQIKQQQLAKQLQKNAQLAEQNTFIKEQLEQKSKELSILKARMQAYSQADVLFEQKDQQIQKLESSLSEIKVKSHLVATELKNQIQQLKIKVKQYEIQKNQILLVSEKYSSQYEMIAIQKQQTENANKKVIQNLKDKIKNLNEKVADQQKTIMEILMEKQNKQKQIYEVERKLQSYSEHSITKSKIQCKNDQPLYRSADRKSTRLDDQLGEFGISVNDQKSLKKYYDILFGESEERCSGELCIAIRSQLVKIVHSILKLNNELDSIDYFSVKNRAQCIENQLQKLGFINIQNMKLKEKIVLLQQSGQPNKQSIQEINKLKKKLLIMKRKLDESEIQRKQEIQLLVSAFQESIQFKFQK